MKKLSLNKKSVASLETTEMQNVKGGWYFPVSTGGICQFIELSRRTFCNSDA